MPRHSVDEVARSALAAIDTDAGFTRTVRWASDRFRELSTRLHLRSLRKVGVITLPAIVDDGTATIARGASVVTGNATAQAAWTDDLVGRWVRLRTVWYEIGNVLRSAGVTSLQLTSPFTENDVSAGAYKIIQRYTRLEPDVRHLGKFVHMRFRRELVTVPLEQLDIMEPDRLLTNAAGPYTVTEVGAAVDGVRIVEFHPYPSLAETVHYVYWETPPELRPGDLLPNGIDPYALREGVLIDLMRYEMGRALESGKVEIGATWRNDYRAQQTVWEKVLTQVQQADQGAEDVTLILRSPTFGFDERRFFRNDSAHTEIYIRGNRP